MEEEILTQNLYIDVPLMQVEKFLPGYRDVRIVLEYSCKYISHYSWLRVGLYGVKIKKPNGSMLLAFIEGAVITSVNRDGEKFSKDDAQEMVDYLHESPLEIKGEDAERGQNASNKIFEYYAETNNKVPDNMLIVASTILNIQNTLEVILPELPLNNLVEGSLDITKESLTRPIDAVFFDEVVSFKKVDRKAVRKILIPAIHLPKSTYEKITEKFTGIFKKKDLSW